MKRFRVLEFTSVCNEETENKLNQEIKENERIVHFSVEKMTNDYSKALGDLTYKIILEVNP